MVQIPDDLHAMFSIELEHDPEGFILEIPEDEVKLGALEPGSVYRAAIISTTETQIEENTEANQSSQSQTVSEEDLPEPPVNEGEIRSVTIESVGDQGDGVAKVDRGYVVIVPGAEPGDNPTVRIEEVKRNVSFAKIVG